MSPKLRFKVFFVGLAPIAVLVLILFMAGRFGLDVFSFMTTVDTRDPNHYVVRTRVLGVTLSERPATQADINEDDALTRVVKAGVLAGSSVIIAGCLVMCFAAAFGRPYAVLSWCERRMGSFQAATPTLRR